ncbi:MAG: Na+/H+ antiporter subunit E [Desulfohalobiaceae bacterium]
MEQNASSSNASRSLRIRGLVLQAFLLMLLWLIFSGHYDFLHILYGVLSVGIVLWLNWQMRSLPLAEDQPCGSTRINISRLMLYLVYLLWQIIKSGVYVAYVILHPKMPIRPILVRFQSQQPNVLAKVILGNSITLTPGTLTVQIDGEKFTVHALTEDTEASLVSGEMEFKVARLYLQECSTEDMCCNVEHLLTGREKG